ncbi:hypothetical protein GE09DRAFT_1085126 [Coniochaeta sp. 2T2.1]|nr:hypothetical protein GE09DRAFT_1085126 [Coniochaeta sp. 2T2.1]
MARPRSFPRLWAILGLVCLMFTLVAASSSSSSSSSLSTPLQPSPSAEVDLICHTEDPSGCYPKVFVPTDEFQIVHPDQDIPPGLHVRLNIYTGEKEAKINVPDETNTELEGLPVDSSVMVVDPPEGKGEAAQIPAGAPVYEPVGKIKEPPKGEESDTFFKSLEILQRGLNLDDALKELQELSHDIYYGLKIAEDYETVKNLFCLANSDWKYRSEEKPMPVRRMAQASSILAGALQNNPKALAEVEKHWEKFEGMKCDSRDRHDMTTSAFHVFVPGSGPSHIKARIGALKALLKSDVIRKDFLAKNSMKGVFDVLIRYNQPEWEPVREKMALLVQDIFLDEDQGAKLGEWPGDEQREYWDCHGRCTGGGEGPYSVCADYWLGVVSARNKEVEDHWSHELFQKYIEVRKGATVPYEKFRNDVFEEYMKTGEGAAIPYEPPRDEL